jgi:hypothetical protein
MDARKRDRLKAALAQRQGWYYAHGLWWSDAPKECEEKLPDVLDGIKQVDFWQVEELLMRFGWRFGFRDGLFVAYRASDGKRVQRRSRVETIAIAYILTPYDGPTKPRAYGWHPPWPAHLERQCWDETSETVEAPRER